MPLPVRATAEQPLIELAPSLKLTVPVGDVPVTVAVNVTLAPTFDGLAELVREVVVAAPPDFVTLTVSELAEAEVTVKLTPVEPSVYVWPTTSTESVKVPGVAGVMSTISVSSEPADHSNGLETRTCAPLFGNEDNAASKPMGCRNSSQYVRFVFDVGICTA